MHISRSTGDSLHIRTHQGCSGGPGVGRGAHVHGVAINIGDQVASDGGDGAGSALAIEHLGRLFIECHDLP